MSNRWINHGVPHLVEEHRASIEKSRNAKFVCELSVKGKFGWTDNPAMIFFQETPPKPEFSNYFGLIHQVDSWYIIDGSSVVGIPIEGIETKAGEIIYSRFRHDFRKAQTEEIWVDGGLDYGRLVGNIFDITHVVLTIKGAELVVVEDQAEIDALYAHKKSLFAK